ncbi:MAG TPA: T9SS type A sorting domain-containing protein [Puia sp.]|nr:T9SS type A sorting domain-containing protein [Puia sp.]
MSAFRKGIPAMGLALCVQCTTYAAGADPSGRQSTFPGSGYDTVHSIQVSKSQSSKKYKIRLYPDARQQVLFFSANGEDGKVYQLFLFDMDGRLVSQTHIRNKETTVLTNISEGNFLFEVFTDDERIENGQLTVR